MAAGQADVPILEITQASVAGHRSFHNHFDSKDELSRAAPETPSTRRPAGPDHDRDGRPAEIFAQSCRLTGCLHRRQPKVSKVLQHKAMTLAGSPKGLAPRAGRDVGQQPHHPH